MPQTTYTSRVSTSSTPNALSHDLPRGDVAEAPCPRRTRRPTPRCPRTHGITAAVHGRLHDQQPAVAAGDRHLDQQDADRAARRHRRRLAARRRHRGHEHHAGLGHRADPRDRPAQGPRRHAPGHPPPVPGRGQPARLRRWRRRPGDRRHRRARPSPTSSASPSRSRAARPPGPWSSRWSSASWPASTRPGGPPGSPRSRPCGPNEPSGRVPSLSIWSSHELPPSRPSPRRRRAPARRRRPAQRLRRVERRVGRRQRTHRRVHGGRWPGRPERPERRQPAAGRLRRGRADHRQDAPGAVDDEPDRGDLHGDDPVHRHGGDHEAGGEGRILRGRPVHAGARQRIDGQRGAGGHAGDRDHRDRGDRHRAGRRPVQRRGVLRRRWWRVRRRVPAARAAGRPARPPVGPRVRRRAGRRPDGVVASSARTSRSGRSRPSPARGSRVAAQTFRPQPGATGLRRRDAECGHPDGHRDHHGLDDVHHDQGRHGERPGGRKVRLRPRRQ